MSTIEVSPNLLKPLQQLAGERGEPVNAIVERLIASFLRDQRHDALLREMEQFRSQHDRLRSQYVGQFIGMYDGRVLDHDEDGGVLYERLRQQYGDLPILIVEVTDQPEQLFIRLSHQIVT